MIWHNGRLINHYYNRKEAENTANLLNAHSSRFYYIPEFYAGRWCIAVHDKHEHLEFWCYL